MANAPFALAIKLCYESGNARRELAETLRVEHVEFAVNSALNDRARGFTVFIY